MAGGRGKTKTLAQLEAALDKADLLLSSDDITPSKARLLTVRLKILQSLHNRQIAEKKDKKEDVQTLKDRITELETENTALKQQSPMIVNNSAADSQLLAISKANFEDAQLQIDHLKKTVGSMTYKLADLAAVKAENERLRAAADKWGQHLKAQRIVELKAKIAEYDARIKAPGAGINLSLSKVAFDKELAAEAADRAELRKHLGKSEPTPQTVVIHPDATEEQQHNSRLSQQIVGALQLGEHQRSIAVEEPCSVPRMPNGDIRLYGYDR
jgi:chromosome segregation ATPase